MHQRPKPRLSSIPFLFSNRTCTPIANRRAHKQNTAYLKSKTGLPAPTTHDRDPREKLKKQKQGGFLVFGHVFGRRSGVGTLWETLGRALGVFRLAAEFGVGLTKQQNPQPPTHTTTHDTTSPVAPGPGSGLPQSPPLPTCLHRRCHCAMHPPRVHSQCLISRSCCRCYY